MAGDVSSIPETAPPDSSVNYETGYPFPYEQNLLTQPTALPIGRTQFNQLMLDATTNLQYYQTHAIPQWITSADNGGSPYSYDVFAQVRYNVSDPGVEGAGTLVYTNQIQGNTSTPGVDDSWLPTGKILTDYVVFADSVALTNTVIVDLLSIDLPVTENALPNANWLVYGNITVIYDTLTTTGFAQFWINDVSVTIPDLALTAAGETNGTPTGTVSFTVPVYAAMSSVGSPLTLYLSGYAGFTTGTAKVCGSLTAIPIR